MTEATMTEEAAVTKEMVEIVEERTLFAKVYDRGEGRRRMIASQVPIHHLDGDGNFQDICMDIKDGRVCRCSYDVSLLDGAMGYRGIDPNGKPIGLELMLLPAVEPVIEGNKATYRDVQKDTDFVVEFSPNAIRANRVVKSAEAPREAEFKITRALEDKGRIANAGADAKGNKTELETEERPVENPEEGTMQKIFKQRWTGRVARMDPETRKREWCDEVEYPVTID